jgi:hypothetical protein
LQDIKWTILDNNSDVPFLRGSEHFFVYKGSVVN